MPAGIPYGEYQLIRKIGAGAMAEVFLARRVGRHGFEKQLVIKRLMPHLCSQARFSEMFINEARLAALIDHPNLAHVSDFGEVAGTFFLAMEYVEGLTLADFLDCVGRVSPAVAARIAIDLLEALSAIHGARDLEGHALQLVHRDVSTRNTMIRADGVVKVLDFGIAVATETTLSGELMGTRGFMSPEQLAGQPLDARSDLYSAGVLIHRMVLGEMPPELGEQRALELGDTPAGLAEIVRSALAADREQRPASAREMQSRLEAFAVECGVEATRAHLAQLVTSARRVTSSPRRLLADLGRRTRITRLTKLTAAVESGARRPGLRPGALIGWSLLGVLAGGAVVAGAIAAGGERANVVHVEPMPLAQTATQAVEIEEPEPEPEPEVVTKPAPAKPKVRGTGDLAIDTSPWTEVFFRGRSLGVTPLEQKGLPSGTHDLELRNSSLSIKKRVRVVIRSGEVTRVYRELTP